MPTKRDPLDAMRIEAGKYEGADAGTACTQSAFRVGKKSFFFVGEQGGRYKAMFKLSASMEEARALAETQPDDYQAGKTGWVTARFSAAKPMPARRWKKWLRESYELATTPAPKKKASRKKKAGAREKGAVKKRAAGRKKAAKRKATKRKR